MNQKLKMLPVLIMLAAGAVTNIITYVLHYESKTALLILLGVLLFFYIAGSLLRKLILRFEKEIEENEKERLEEEGKVVEKDKEAAEASSEKKSENELKDAGEQ